MDELRPFLKSHCADCHEGASAERELDLVSLAMPAAEPESLAQMVHDLSPRGGTSDAAGRS